MTFDSTVIGQPYTRVQDIRIEYTGEHTCNVHALFRNYVPLIDGSHAPIGEEFKRCIELRPDNMSDPVELFMPGGDIPLGISTTIGDLMVGVFSVIRNRMF